MWRRVSLYMYCMGRIMNECMGVMGNGSLSSLLISGNDVHV